MLKEKEFIPQLRFPGFEKKWEEKKMKTLFSISAGGDVKKNNVSRIRTEKFRYPIYANSEKNKGLYGYSDIYKVEGETLTITGRGVNIGVAHSRKEKYFPIVRLLVLKPKENESVRFFEYQFNKQNIFFESTGVPQLTAPQVSTYKVFKPSFPEQQKIANFLSAVDTRIQSLEKKKDLLEQYKKGVMQQLFKQEIRFKDDEGNDFPEWEINRIGKVFNERNEKNFTEMKLLSISINKGIYPQSESNKKDSSNSNKSKYKRVLKNDIAYNSMRMWQGASAVSEYNGIVSPAYTILEGNHYNDSRFFGYLFKMSFMIQTFQKHSQGLTSDTWNLKYPMISKIKVIVPCLLEQTKIANFLTAIDQKIDLVDQQIEHAKTHKKGLLQQMFV